MPVPRAVIIRRISSDDSILSRRAFSTLRILPLSGRMAWKRRSRPCLAVPPALSPSTRKISQRRGSFSWQSGSFPRARRFDRFDDDLLTHGRVLFKELAELLIDELRHVAGDVAIELALG